MNYLSREEETSPLSRVLETHRFKHASKLTKIGAEVGRPSLLNRGGESKIDAGACGVVGFFGAFASSSAYSKRAAVTAIPGRSEQRKPRTSGSSTSSSTCTSPVPNNDPDAELLTSNKSRSSNPKGARNFQLQLPPISQSDQGALSGRASGGGMTRGSGTSQDLLKTRRAMGLSVSTATSPVGIFASQIQGPTTWRYPDSLVEASLSPRGFPSPPMFRRTSTAARAHMPSLSQHPDAFKSSMSAPSSSFTSSNGSMLSNSTIPRKSLNGLTPALIDNDLSATPRTNAALAVGNASGPGSTSPDLSSGTRSVRCSFSGVSGDATCRDGRPAEATNAAKSSESISLLLLERITGRVLTPLSNGITTARGLRPVDGSVDSSGNLMSTRHTTTSVTPLHDGYGSYSAQPGLLPIQQQQQMQMQLQQQQQMQSQPIQQRTSRTSRTQRPVTSFSEGGGTVAPDRRLQQLQASQDGGMAELLLMLRHLSPRNPNHQECMGPPVLSNQPSDTLRWSPNISGQLFGRKVINRDSGRLACSPSLRTLSHSVDKDSILFGGV